jgi:hypothetical protein
MDQNNAMRRNDPQGGKSTRLLRGINDITTTTT